MFIFIGGGPLLLGPPNAYLWGVRTPPPQESTRLLLTNFRAITSILGVLGLDLHSSSTKPVNFFGAQSSLGEEQFSFGGHTQSFGGARPRNAPPRGAGTALNSLFMLQNHPVAGGSAPQSPL